MSVEILRDNTAAAIAASLAATKAGNKALADLIAASAIEEIEHGPKSGAVYAYGQASAPGQAPAVDTGDLKDGIEASAGGESETDAGVVSKDWKSDLLEHGSAAAHIAPRPFLGPAADKHKADQARLVAEEFAKAFGGGK